MDFSLVNSQWDLESTQSQGPWWLYGLVDNQTYQRMKLYFPLMEYFEQEGKAGGHGDEKGPRSQLYLPLMVYSELTRALLSIDGLFQARAFDCQFIGDWHHPVK